MYVLIFNRPVGDAIIRTGSIPPLTIPDPDFTCLFGAESLEVEFGGEGPLPRLDLGLRALEAIIGISTRSDSLRAGFLTHLSMTIVIS